MVMIKSMTDVASGILLLIFCSIGFWSVAQLPDGGSLEHIGPGGVPKAVLVLLTLLSLLLTWRGIRRRPSEPYWPAARIFRKIVCFFLLFYAYLFSVITLGDIFASMENPPFAWGGAFGCSTFCFLCIALPMLGRRKPIEVFLVAAITTTVLLVSFGWFFQVMLP